MLLVNSVITFVKRDKVFCVTTFSNDLYLFCRISYYLKIKAILKMKQPNNKSQMKEIINYINLEPTTIIIIAMLMVVLICLLIVLPLLKNKNVEIKTKYFSYKTKN
jgi:hypothetical protein